LPASGEGAEVLPVRRHAELVLLIDLPRQTSLHDLLVLMQDGLTVRADIVVAIDVVRVGVVERVGDVVLREQISARREEPHLVAHDGPAESGIEIAVLLDGVRRGQTARLDVAAGEVVGNEVFARVAAEKRSAEPVAAVARDEVDADAAGRRLRVNGGDIDRELGGAGGVGDGAAAPAARNHRAQGNAVDHHPLVGCSSAVGLERGNFLNDRPANVLTHECAFADAGYQHADRERCTRAGNGRHQLLVEHRLSRCRFQIDHRCVAGDGHRFLNAANGQVGVYGKDARAAQLDALVDHGLESRQRERHTVRAWPQVRNRIAAVGVAGGRSRFLDERRTRRFHRDAGQDRATGVADKPGERRLRVSDGRQKEQEREPR
jgi:hypothetical protein